MITKAKKSSSADKVASILLKIKAVTLRLDPPYTWTSGIKSPIYTDNRLLMSYVDERKAVVDAFVKLIEDEEIEIDGIAATATAGIPWGAWIADRLKVPMVFVRGKAKGHGKENAVEGVVIKGSSYLIIEDLISTGGSSVHTAQQVRAQGGAVDSVAAIFSYGLPSSKENFSKERLKAICITDFAALIAVASKEGYIKKEDEQEVLKWKENPSEWRA
ncbi:MAG TPA: orotate phosphoribosyltransferase [Candidatus Nanoarchaeia archaeon]|nr:orotate phosphoribosyltransferase [Candidatus Nanoarchaeia archaeon]